MERENKTTRTEIGIEPLTDKAKKKIMVNRPEDDCFSQMWDMSTRACQICADNEVCGILYADVVKAKVQVFESTHSPTLDKADLSLICEEEVMQLITSKSGSLTATELVDYLKKKARLDDDIAIVEWIKRFREHTGKAFSIREGVVYAKP